MVLRKLMGVFMATLIIGAASFAMAGVPDLDLSTHSTGYGGPSTLSLFNLPNAGGNAFTQAFLPAGGGFADGTITLTLRDGLGAVIADYPFEDLTLASAGMVPCTGGVTADANTDALGQTQWQTPLAAGGYTTAGLTQIEVAGAPLNSGDVAMIMNSADINGDGTVNLSDVGIFSSVFYGAYSYSADFNNDGLVNLSDVGLLASGVGGSCP